MPIYCDESGGVGRGIMTMGAIYISEEKAAAILQRFRDVTGRKGELKGSRIDLAERALIMEMIAASRAPAVISIALSVTRTPEGEARGTHDIAIYAALMDDAVGALLPLTNACGSVWMDAGRYGAPVLEKVRRNIAEIAGPWNVSQLEESDRLAGLQLADVIANSFFNRARVSGKQARIAAAVQPMLESGQFDMRILGEEDVDPFEMPPAASKPAAQALAKD